MYEQFLKLAFAELPLAATLRTLSEMHKKLAILEQSCAVLAELQGVAYGYQDDDYRHDNGYQDGEFVDNLRQARDEVQRVCVFLEHRVDDLIGAKEKEARKTLRELAVLRNLSSQTLTASLK